MWHSWPLVQFSAEYLFASRTLWTWSIVICISSFAFIGIWVFRASTATACVAFWVFSIFCLQTFLNCFCRSFLKAEPHGQEYCHKKGPSLSLLIFCFKCSFFNHCNVHYTGKLSCVAWVHWEAEPRNRAILLPHAFQTLAGLSQSVSTALCLETQTEILLGGRGGGGRGGGFQDKKSVLGCPVYEVARLQWS